MKAAQLSYLRESKALLLIIIFCLSLINSPKSAASDPSQSDGAVAASTSVTEENPDKQPGETQQQSSDKSLAPATELKADDPETELQEQHNRAVGHWMLSKNYLKDWDLDLARTELDLCVLDWPELAVAHRDLCLLSLLQFNLGRSVAEFMMTVGLGEPVPMTAQEAQTLLKEGMIMHYNKGLLYARKQDWKNTINELKIAEQLMPDNFAVQRSLAYACGKSGEFREAEQHYRKTFELAPADGSSRADLAYLLQDSGKPGEALKAMEDAVKSEPDSAAYHVDLSWMAESRGDLDTAGKELERALSLSPEHAALWAQLGRVRERRGEISPALDAYRKAININPEMGDAKEAISKLESEKAKGSI